MIGLQKFIFCQCLLRWMAVCLWIVFSILAYRRTFYTEHELRQLRLATALSAFFFAAATAMLATLVHFVAKVSRSRQIW